MLTSLFKPIIPNLMPEYGSSNKFRRDEFGLIDDDIRMLTHFSNNSLGCRFSSRNVGFRSHSNGVDECLRMYLADIVEQADDEGGDGLPGSVDTGDNLRDDLEPDVYIDRRETIDDGVCDSTLITVREPERQQSERVLKRISRRERNGSKETLYGRDNVAIKVLSCQCIGNDFELSDYLKIGQSPGMPCLVPIRVELCRQRVVGEDGRGVMLPSE